MGSGDTRIVTIWIVLLLMKDELENSRLDFAQKRNPSDETGPDNL